MLRTKAIATDKTHKLFPPWDKKGKVTPVDGIKPEIPPMLIKVCTNIMPPIPMAIIELNGFFARIPTKIMRRIKKNKRARIKLAPTKPNSSITIENTKSVCASGR